MMIEGMAPVLEYVIELELILKVIGNIKSHNS